MEAGRETFPEAHWDESRPSPSPDEIRLNLTSPWGRGGQALPPGHHCHHHEGAWRKSLGQGASGAFGARNPEEPLWGTVKPMWAPTPAPTPLALECAQAGTPPPGVGLALTCLAWLSRVSFLFWQAARTVGEEAGGAGGCGGPGISRRHRQAGGSCSVARQAGFGGMGLWHDHQSGPGQPNGIVSKIN